MKGGIIQVQVAVVFESDVVVNSEAIGRLKTCVSARRQTQVCVYCDSFEETRRVLGGLATSKWTYLEAITNWCSGRRLRCGHLNGWDLSRRACFALAARAAPWIVVTVRKVTRLGVQSALRIGVVLPVDPNTVGTTVAHLDTFILELEIEELK
jgi:hypothetical protein